MSGDAPEATFGRRGSNACAARTRADRAVERRLDRFVAEARALNPVSVTRRRDAEGNLSRNRRGGA